MVAAYLEKEFPNMPTKTSYTYPTSAFKNSKCDLSRLEDDIQANAAVTVGLVGSEADRNGNVTLTFKDVLDELSKTALDGDAGAAASATPSVGSAIYEHSGEPLPSENLDAEGNLIVAPTFLYSGNTARLKGYRITAPAGQQVIHDVEVTTQLLVQGGQFWITNAGPEDYVDFAVYDKNGVIPYPGNPSISLMEAYGLTPGVDVLELTKYVDHMNIPEMPYFQDNIIMPTVAPVLQGLFLRTIYHNTGVNDVVMSLTYRWYEA